MEPGTRLGFGFLGTEPETDTPRFFKKGHIENVKVSLKLNKIPNSLRILLGHYILSIVKVH
jgi:hypothetical protein